MPKPHFKILLVLLIFASIRTVAQNQQEVFDRYLVKYPHFSPAMFYVEDRFLVANPLPDSLDVQVDTLADLQKIINKNLQTKVYAVEIRNAKKQNLEKIFSMLTRFPNLIFLKIDDVFFPDPKAPIYKIPDNIQLLHNLRGIEFFFTDKIDLDDAFNKLTTLKQLNTLAISGYNHPAPPSLSKLIGVKYIKLASANLVNLDVKYCAWEKIILSGSAPKYGQDADVLPRLSGIKTLDDLKLDYYMLGDAAALSAFNQLSTLSLNGCYFAPSVSLFNKVSALNNLISLSVRLFSDSTQTITGVERLTNLRSLDIVMSSISKNPDQLNFISNLTNLTSLRLRCDKLTVLPDIFNKLSQLKQISISGTELTKLPNGLFNLPALEYLDISANKLQQLPDNQYYGCKNLKTLLLSYNGITALPAAITHLIKLQKVDASSNKIKTTPTNWKNLKNLKEINLAGNNIISFPNGLQQISALEKMDLHANFIDHIPDLSGANYRLKCLDLSMNELAGLPENIGRFNQLEILNISGNRLNSLPESLGDCVKLKNIDAHTESRRSSYDATKPERERYSITKLDSTKFNHIKSLPAGLANALQLKQLRLDGNPDINSESVFYVLLAAPRTYFRVDLSNCQISTLPESKKWANVQFAELNLSRNNLTTLPVSLATMKRFDHISIYKNPLPVDAAVIAQEINSKADLKLVYDEIKIELPGAIISNSEYAIALAKRVSNYYYKSQWASAVAYANRAIALDSVAYGSAIQWDEIGIARYNFKDYNGAINDFAHFMTKEAKTFIHWGPSLTAAEYYKAKAHLALGQKEKAAQTHEYFAKKHSSETGLQEAAVLYKAIGREDKYRQLMDTALLNHKLKLESYSKQKHTNVNLILGYAEVMLMANKPADVITLFNGQDSKLFTKDNLSTKNYLLATANYLIKPDQFPEIKKTLIADINTNGKVTGWDFDMFNSWVNQTIKDPIKKEQIIALQNIVK